MDDEYFALTNDGQMTMHQMIQELERDRVAPVITTERDGVTVVLLFKTPRIMDRFVQRNFPKGYIFAHLKVELEDYTTIFDNGWDIERLSFPRKMPCEVSILELNRKVEVRKPSSEWSI